MVQRTNDDKPTQFSIKLKTKHRLDRYKSHHKEGIIEKYKKQKNFATNDDAINHLLDAVRWKR